MGSKSSASIALFLALNLVFFSLFATATTRCPPPPKPKQPPCPCSSSPKPPSTPKPSTPKSPPTPTPSTPKPPSTPSTPTPKTPPSQGNCPVDILKLGVCGNLLGGLVGVVLGTPSNSACCTLLQGVADLDAAICLCTAIKANLLGLNLNVPVSLSLLLNACGNTLPSDFECK